MDTSTPKADPRKGSITNDLVFKKNSHDPSIISDFDDFFTASGSFVKGINISELFRIGRRKLVYLEDEGDDESVKHVTLREYLDEWREFPRDSMADMIRTLLVCNDVIRKYDSKKSLLFKGEIQTKTFTEIFTIISSK